MSTAIVLPDTSLATIVRDAEITPAGGIVKFVESTAPFVEEAVIVDTGSRDRTRQLLEELSGTYRNLRLYDRPFDGFDTSKNHSLELVRTRLALILDADELLTAHDFSRLAALVRETPVDGYWFTFLNIYPDGKTDYGNGTNPRLFKKEGRRYVGAVWEFLLPTSFDDIDTGLAIKHFRPAVAALDQKGRCFYREIENAHNDRAAIRSLAFSTLPGFSEWNNYNPQRELYR